jgi:hypothetical protein
MKFNIRKTLYGGQYADVRTYEKPIIIPLPPDDKGKRGEGGEKSLGESRRRAIQSITGLALSNTWDWFVTLTLNPQKVDRHNYSEIAPKLSKWLRNASQRQAKGMAYLMVPELHKDGAFHFHGLFKHCEGLRMTPSGKKDKQGREIYNVGLYGLGWTTATQVEDSIAAALYLVKYITKDLCAVTFNRKRYWATRDLAKAETTTDLLQDEDRKTLEDVLQGSSDRTGTLTVNEPGFKNTIRYYQARTV